MSENSDCTIYIAPIPMGVGKADIRAVFESKFGTVTSIRFPSDQKLSAEMLAQRQRYVFLDFQYPFSAEAALKMDRFQQCGNIVSICEATNKKEKLQP